MLLILKVLLQKLYMAIANKEKNGLFQLETGEILLIY